MNRIEQSVNSNEIEELKSTETELVSGGWTPWDTIHGSNPPDWYKILEEIAKH